MHTGRAQGQAGYATIAQQLAQQALSVAEDHAPHRARDGERRWPMAGALPTARVLVEQGGTPSVDGLSAAVESLGQTLAEPAGKVTDGFGHARPAYAWLALHLFGTAGRLIGDAHLVARIKTVVATRLQQEDNESDPRLLIWRDVLAGEHGLAEAAQRVGSTPPHDRQQRPSPLQGLSPDDLIDAWTYNELVGLHGHYLLALQQDDSAAMARARSAAHYHLGHTQPDYTTYQPWALAAFASDPETALFAEQQLHDVATHLTLEGPGGAVLPALLLADAAAAMSGRLERAWR